MKYLERIGLVGTIHTILIAIVPYGAIFFNWEEDKETIVTQLILLTAIIIVSLITLLFAKKRVTNYARVEGFAWGYFYNFLYELADLIDDKEANIFLNEVQVKTATEEKNPDLDYSREYEKEEIKILIIVPNDLHSEFRLAKIISNIFDEVTVSPGEKSYYSIRKKYLKGYGFEQNNKKFLLLIDTPPTTMRAIKLYEESCCEIDHNDAFKQLDDKSRKRFNKICKIGRKKISPIFKKSLDEIILNLTQGARRHTYNDLIEVITIDNLIEGIIYKSEFEKLERIGDNLSNESINETNRVKKIVNDRKEQLLIRLENLISNKI